MKWLVVLAAAACAKVATVESAPYADAGGIVSPQVSQIDPAPGPISAGGKFTITFSEPMDEGVLLASSGRSETVVLATDAQVEAVAAAIAHDSLSVYERSLLVPAAAQIAASRDSITLTPDVALTPGNYWLLVSPRLRDDGGHKLSGDTSRWEFSLAAPPAHVTLVSPAAGSQAPENLSVVRASAPSGKVSLVAADGTVLASADSTGEVTLQLAAPLAAGAQLSLALDGAVDPSQSFTVANCSRSAPPTLQNGAAQLSPSDTGVTASLALDWPALVEVQVGLASDGAPCSTGSCTTVDAQVSCSPPACGPQTFSCTAAIKVPGLQPATDYSLRVIARDDFGFSTMGAVQPFSTVAPLPHLMISEVMVAPFSPEEEGEYVEILNVGPGIALLDPLALMAGDGVVRPLTATLPPVPTLLFPGQRALAVGAAFDVSRYGDIPLTTPVMRASTQKLFSYGLNDLQTQSFQLVLGIVPIELASFPGGKFHCPSNASVQRDESVASDDDAKWTCGPVGGTPGAAP